MAKQDKDFDDLLREKLEGLELPYRAEDWLLFEQKLENSGMGVDSAGTPAADVKSIDEAVFDKLHRYEAPYQPSHWLRMELLLEEVFTWPQTILRYKLAELALMLLLFAALWQHIPAGLPLEQGPQAYQLPAAPSEGSQPSAAEGLEAPAAPSSSDALQVESEQMPADAAVPSLLAPANPAAAPNAAAAPPSGRQRPGIFLSLNPLALPGLSAALPQPAWALPDEWPRLNRFAGLAALPPLPERQPLLLVPAERVAELAFKRPQKSRPSFRVGMLGNADYNHIIVPANEEKRLFQGFDRHALGYGGGLSLSFEISRRWELELGALYAARQYPIGIIYVEGSLSSGLQGSELRASELNMINLPLHLRYNFLCRGNWRAYVLGGAAAQVVFQSNYYAAEAPAFDYRPIIAPPEPEAGDENIIIQLRREGLAWFEGGTFKENAYLTANLGFGAERYVGARWSVFAQPTLQYSFHYLNEGLGPNKDRINSLSLWFGTRVRLR